MDTGATYEWSSNCDSGYKNPRMDSEVGFNFEVDESSPQWFGCVFAEGNTKVCGMTLMKCISFEGRVISHVRV